MSNEDLGIDARSIAAEVEAEMGDTATQPAPEAEKAPEPEQPKVEAKKPEAEAPKTEPETEPEKEQKPKPSERQSKFVPVSKANAWRHEANEAKARIAALEAENARIKAEKAKVSEDDVVSAKAKAIAEARGVDPEAVKDILLAAREGNRPVESESTKKVLELAATLEQEKNDRLFQKELDATLTKYPELKAHADELRTIAHAEGHESVPLHLLALQLREDLNLSSAPPSAEGKAPQVAAPQTLDFSTMTEDEILKLSPEDTDKYIAYTQAGVKTRTGRSV